MTPWRDTNISMHMYGENSLTDKEPIVDQENVPGRRDKQRAYSSQDS